MMRRSRRNPAPAGVPKLFGFRRRQRAQPAPDRVEPPAAPAPPAPPETIAPPDVGQLEAEERYHRERLALYRARAYSSRPTSPARLRELGRIWEAAKARLTHARSQRR